ncbi:hypothetical protein C2S52_005598 [Perilla frutescens var. hirtella]|nr:hypothetical protein C2S52_005598 [Perilla frutescens var. hirtella]
MYINSHRYDVKAINYNNFTIRLADVSINTSWSSICSFTASSAFEYSLPFSIPDHYFIDETHRINFMSCPYPLHNFSTWHSDCDKALNSSHGRHTYIKFGDFLAKDVDYMCTVYAAVPTSWNFTDMDNVSLSEIHQSLLYGFELSWFRFLCRKCGGAGCSVRISDGQIICSLHHSSFYYNWEKIMHSFQPPDGPTAGCLMILMLIVGVSIPAKIIIGFGASYWVFVKDWWHPNIQRILGAHLIYALLFQLLALK